MGLSRLESAWLDNCNRFKTLKRIKYVCRTQDWVKCISLDDYNAVHLQHGNRGSSWSNERWKNCTFEQNNNKCYALSSKRNAFCKVSVPIQQTTLKQGVYRTQTSSTDTVLFSICIYLPFFCCLFKFQFSSFNSFFQLCHFMCSNQTASEPQSAILLTKTLNCIEKK